MSQIENIRKKSHLKRYNNQIMLFTTTYNNRGQLKVTNNDTVVK